MQVAPIYKDGDMREMANYYAALVDITLDLRAPKTGVYVESSMTALYLNTLDQRTAVCTTLRAVFPEWKLHPDEASASAFEQLPSHLSLMRLFSYIAVLGTMKMNTRLHEFSKSFFETFPTLKQLGDAERRKYEQDKAKHEAGGA
jgi:hypothetical protein